MPGATLGAVYRRLHLDGRRDAYVRVFDGTTWSERLPLPPRPRKVWQPAVRRARAWVADRDGSGMALPHGSAEGAANARVRRTRTRERRREPAHAA